MKLYIIISLILVCAVQTQVFAAEIRTDTFRTEGESSVRLKYGVAGKGDEVILFLHGFPQFWYMWDKQLSFFGESQRAVALSLRGYSGSSKPWAKKKYGLQYYIEDIKQFIVSLTDRPVVLVGHDLGGFIAHGVAIQYPELVEKLVVINAPHPAVFEREILSREEQRRAIDYMISLRHKYSHHWINWGLKSFLNRVLYPYDPEYVAFPKSLRRRYLKDWRWSRSMRSATNVYRAAEMGPPDHPKVLDGKYKVRTNYLDFLDNQVIDAKTMYIWGMNDAFLLPSNLDGIEAYVPDVRIEKVPNQSHWIVNERPDLINQLISNFLSN